MASTLYVAEYKSTAKNNKGEPVMAPLEPADQEQVIDFSAGEATLPLPFLKTTRFVSITCDDNCHYLVGANPTATVNNKRLAAGAERFFGVDGFHQHTMSAIGA